jgi:DNA-binding transcriptional regulator GbsR (MarR family)
MMAQQKKEDEVNLNTSQVKVVTSQIKVVKQPDLGEIITVIKQDITDLKNEIKNLYQWMLTGMK